MRAPKVERLEKKLARVAREQGLNQERLRRWVSFLALCGVLERALREGLLSSYCVKGGAAMELRFAQHARATKDLDIGMDAPRADRLKILTHAVQLGFDEFTFRIKAQTRDMEKADAIRVEVAVAYRTRAWQTIELDLGAGVTGHVDLIEPRVQGLEELGIPVVSPIHCLNLADQVAQKLHACTGPASSGRARDILDILLIDQLGELKYREAGDATRRVFAERGTHAFPPAAVIPDEWNVELERLADELGFHLKTRDEIEKRFREVIVLLSSDRADA